MAAYTWQGGTGSFTDPAQWTGGTSYPQAGDDATFGMGGTVNGGTTATGTITVNATVTFSGGDITADQLYISAGNTVGLTGGGTLEPDLLNIDGTLNVTAGGTLDSTDTTIGFTAGGAGVMTVDGAGTTWDNTGQLLIGTTGTGASSGTLTVSDYADVTVGSADADFTFVGEGGGLTVTSHATFETNILNIAGHTTTIEDNATLTLDGDATDGGAPGPAALYDNFILDVDNATLDAAGSIIVANRGAGGNSGRELEAFMTVSNGSTVTDDFMALGYDQDITGTDQGELDITGAGTTWTDHGDGGGPQAGNAFIGVSGVGGLSVEQGATLTEDGSAYLAYGGDADGTVTVATGGSWTVTDALNVGYGYQGHLTVETAGTVMADTLDISVDASVNNDGFGTVIINGDGSTVTVTDLVTVGDGGTGELTVEANGMLTAGSMEIGAQDGSGQYQPTQNFLEITGEGSTVTVNDTIEIGVAGPGDLTLADSGTLNTGDATLGVDATGDGSATIGDGSDNTATWTITGDLTIGEDGTASVEVQDGGVLDVTGSITLGANGDPGDGTLTLTGANVTFTTSGSGFTIGESGSGTVIVEEGATLDAGADDVSVAEKDGSDGTLTVTGDGSQFTADNLTVGAGGTGSASVEDSATLTVNTDLKIGEDGGGTVMVQSAGTLSVTGDITLGENANSTGELDIDGDTSSVTSDNITIGSVGGATLSITNSGGLTTSGDAMIADKLPNPAVVESVTVDSNGTWIITGNLTIAGSGAATMTVQGGAQVSAYAVTIADQAGSSAIVTVQDETSALPAVRSGLGYGGTLTIGNAGMATLNVLDGGLVAPTPGGTGEIDIAASAAPPDTTVVDAVTVDGTGAAGDASALEGTNLWVGGTAAGAGGVATLTISNGGLVSVSDATVYAGSSILLNNGNLDTDPITIDAGARMTGSGTVLGDITDNGTITADGTGLLNIGGTVTGTGTLAISQNGNMLLDGTVDPGLSIDMGSPGDDAALGLVFPWQVHATITDFFSGDVISLGELMNADPQFIGNTLQITSSDRPTIDLVFTAGYNDGNVTLTTDPTSSYVTLTTDVPCFADGTRIRTARGPVAVEQLVVGDRVLAMTAGVPGLTPIVWIGVRRVDLAAASAARPIRIRAGAFGPALPQRDLLLSPDHAVFAEGALIPAKLLVNGATVVEDSERSVVTYFHVECAAHEILLAEGLTVESYLDTGNRAGFDLGEAIAA